jgi:hypothetical protein
VGVIERAFLLAMRRGIGVIAVEHKGGGRLRGAGNAVVDQRVGEAVEVLAVDAVCQRRKGGALAKACAGSRGGRSTLR